MRSKQARSFSKIQLAMVCSAIVVAAVLLVAIPAGAQSTTIKLVPITYTNPAAGDQMYAKYCASCHGIAGQGNGPAAPAFKHAPANLTKLTKSHGGKYPRMLVYESVMEGGNVRGHGNARMPVWGDLFVRMDGLHSQIPQMRLKALADYIESLQAK
jgi:mono/diheme cytochrome c family protein